MTIDFDWLDEMAEQSKPQNYYFAEKRLEAEVRGRVFGLVADVLGDGLRYFDAMNGGETSRNIKAIREFVGNVVSGILDSSGRFTQYVIGDENARKVSEFEAKIVGEVKEFAAPVTKPIVEAFVATERSLTEGQKTLLKFGVGVTEFIGIKQIMQAIFKPSVKSFDLPKKAMLDSEQINSFKSPTRGETLSGFEIKPYAEVLPEKPLFASKVTKIGDDAGLGFKHHVEIDGGLLARNIEVDTQQIQMKFKHAAKFGVEGNFNKPNAEIFKQKILDHIADKNTVAIAGSYSRGKTAQDVVHYYNPKTGLNVMKGMDGKFISGWKLTQRQSDFIEEIGKIGGGE